jgi:hypothetical protein
MLNLFVNFMKIHFLLPLTMLLIAAQGVSPVAITSPAPGDTLSGGVTITGTTDVQGFVSSRLDFSYASDSTDTWFSLGEFSQPEVNSPLADWDTTLITDGDYILRLRVTLQDGSFEDVTIPIKIRNDLPIPTPTPISTSTPNRLDSQMPTPFLIAASPTPTLTPRPTPTPFAANAVSLDQTSIYISLGRGALVIAGLFVFVGLILRIRRY